MQIFRVLILGWCVVGFTAGAFAGDDCIIGGRYHRSDVEEAFKSQIGYYTKVSITKCVRSWMSYFPTTWVLDDVTKTMSFKMERGDKYFSETDTLVNCTGYYSKSKKNLLISDCVDDKDYNPKKFRTGEFGLYSETIQVDLSSLKRCDTQ